MTTRIDNVTWLNPEQANLTIDPNDVKRLLKKYSHELPQNCFLADLEDEADQNTKEKIKCHCGTQSYGNAKFCRECGSKLGKKAATRLELNTIDWSDDDYDAIAANTFFPIFIEKVVPCLQGTAECSITFGDDNNDGEDIVLQTAHFFINEGTLTWCEIVLKPTAEAPVFTADDLHESDDNSDDED